MSLFSIAIMLNSKSLAVYLTISKVVENSNSPKLDNTLLGVITKSIENSNFLWVCAKFSKSIQIFVNFTIGMIENEMGHLLECVKL